MDSPKDVTVRVVAEEVNPLAPAQLSKEPVGDGLSSDLVTELKEPCAWTGFGVKPFENVPGMIELFDASSAYELGSARLAALKSSDESGGFNALLKGIKRKGGGRALKCLNADWPRALDALQLDFPNFAEVIDFLRGQFSLTSGDSKVLSFDPCLLDGPPGVGKSYFAEELGRLLGVPFIAMRMENAQSNGQLVGSDEFWANSKPGAVFNALVQGDVANPLFFLDELDKAAGDERYNPISGLYSLLEEGTAKSFADLSWPWLEMDAGHINWIFATNLASVLPEPIRSRVRIFSIPSPTPEQSQRIALKLFRQLQRDIPVAKEIRLTWEAVKLISSGSPRAMKKQLREAIGRAVYEKRRRIDAGDLSRASAAPSKRSIGFVLPSTGGGHHG